MEIAIIVIVVTLAVIAVAYNLYRIFTKKDGCACSGNATCPSSAKDPCAPCAGCRHDEHMPTAAPHEDSAEE